MTEKPTFRVPLGENLPVQLLMRGEDFVIVCGPIGITIGRDQARLLGLRLVELTEIPLATSQDN